LRRAGTVLRLARPRRRLPRVLPVAAGGVARPRADARRAHAGGVALRPRLRRRGDAVSERGVVVWLTGLPRSGTPTLAEAVRAALAARGRATLVLDGDAVRAALVPSPGYDAAARDAFYATLARLAALAARQGLVVLVPATAHRRAYRDEARAVAP